MLKTGALFSIPLIFLSSIGFSQKKERNIFLDAGYLGRTTIFYLKGTKGLSNGPLLIYDAPYTYKSGVNGTGVNLAIGYRLSQKYGLNVQAGTTIRYDFYYYGYDCDCHIKTFYVDESLFVTKSFRKRFYAGIGFTVYNIGRELNYHANGEDKTLELQFNSLDFILGASIWKLYFEPKVSLVQSNFPGHIKENATLLGARVYYRFNLKRKGP